LLSALVGLAVAYLAGVVTIAADVREVFPTLLAAATVLPLMLLFVLLPPTVVISVLTGVTISLIAKSGSRIYLIGAAAGLLFGMILLWGVLPLFITPTPGDFTSLVTRPFWSAMYALFLGLLASRFFSWFSKR
jgi:hypothetical protein